MALPDQQRAALTWVAEDFDALVAGARVDELDGPTNGTRWTNEQLLFHMLFGYLIVRTLLPLVRVLSRAPRPVSAGFAATLNAATRPFHVINYVGSLGGARILGHAGMERVLDRVVAHLQTGLLRESETGLRRSMPFPGGWDPYFTADMSVADVYHYATQHFDHHRRQLTLRAATQP